MNGNRLLIKVLLIGALVVVLFIGIGLMSALVSERQSRLDSATTEVAGLWGKGQILTGPILRIPFNTYSYSTNGTLLATGVDAITVLPENLIIESQIPTEVKHRGIYKIRTYKLSSKISGNFSMPDFDKLKIKRSDIRWSEAMIFHQVNDAKSLEDRVFCMWDTGSVELEPDIEAHSEEGATRLSRLVAIDSTLSRGEPLPNFEYSIKINGTDKVMFTPLGTLTTIKVSSSWPHPSFVGAKLPSSSNITEDGFTSIWKSTHVSRPFPRVWLESSSFMSRLNESNYGVSLIEPVDVYQQLERVLKYVLLVILLTFALFFVLEVLSKKEIHPMQYSLVGFALVVFYLLLMALSEHLEFTLSYLASAGLVVALVGSYMRFVVSKSAHVVIVAGSLSTLYGYIYVVLLAEEMSLLIGSFGLFAVIALLMFATRNVDWYAWQTNKQIE